MGFPSRRRPSDGPRPEGLPLKCDYSLPWPTGQGSPDSSNCVRCFQKHIDHADAQRSRSALLGKVHRTSNPRSPFFRACYVVASGIFEPQTFPTPSRTTLTHTARTLGSQPHYELRAVACPRWRSTSSINGRASSLVKVARASCSRVTASSILPNCCRQRPAPRRAYPPSRTWP